MCRQGLYLLVLAVDWGLLAATYTYIYPTEVGDAGSLQQQRPQTVFNARAALPRRRVNERPLTPTVMRCAWHSLTAALAMAAAHRYAPVATTKATTWVSAGP